MRTLFLQAPSFDGFEGGAGARYQTKREVASFWYPTWLAQPAALVQASLAAPYPGTFVYKQALENGWLDDTSDSSLVNEDGRQIAPLSYPGLSHTEIFDSVEQFYRRFYFRSGKIAAIVGEMVRSPQMMKRRLREGVEFFHFLRERSAAH